MILLPMKHAEMYFVIGVASFRLFHHSLSHNEYFICECGTTKNCWGRWRWLLCQIKIKHKTNCSSQYSYLLSIRKCILLLVLDDFDCFTTHFYIINILYARVATKKWWGRWWWLLFQLKINHKTNSSSQYSYLLRIRKCILLLVLDHLDCFITHFHIVNIYAHVAWQKSGEADGDDYYFNWRLNIKQTVHHDTLTYWAYGNVFCYLFLHLLDCFTTHFYIINILYACVATKKWWDRWWWLLFQLKIKYKTNCSSQYSYLLSIRKCILLLVLHLFYHQTTHFNILNILCAHGMIISSWVQQWLLLF